MIDADCQATLADISVFLDGELDEASCARIEHHCARCERCAALVERLKETTGLCRRLGATPLPPAVAERARRSIRRLLEQSDGNG